MRERRKDPLKGQTFGWLKVIRHVGSSRDGSRYLCKCKCGEEKVAVSALLKRGKIRSCGCIKSGPKPKKIPRSRFAASAK